MSADASLFSSAVVPISANLPAARVSSPSLSRKGRVEPEGLRAPALDLHAFRFAEEMFLRSHPFARGTER